MKNKVKTYSSSTPLPIDGKALCMILGLLLTTTLIAVSGCTPRVSNLPENQPIRSVSVGQDGKVVEESSVITHGLEEERPLTSGVDPWRLAQEAESAAPGKREALLLEAIGGFIDIGRYATARTLLEQLAPAQLSTDQQHRYILLQARLAQAMGDAQKALQLLQPLISNPALPPSDRSQALLLRANAQTSLKQFTPAVLSLLDRDAILEGIAQVENQRRLLNLLGALSPQQLQQMKAESADTYLTGWIELAWIFDQTPLADREQQIARWRDLYPHHPASTQLLAPQGHSIGQSANYNSVALLLPMTSPSGNAAQAFYEGFMAAHVRSTAPQRPSISLHDIGSDGSLAAFYYQAARNEKVDFVVGPLGRMAVAQLLAQTTPDLPTLLLGPVRTDNNLPNLYNFSLSPEQDARQAAAQASSHGHRKAVVIGADSTWGRRVGEAFASEWQSLGGTLVAADYFPPQAVDLSTTIKKALAISLGYEKGTEKKQAGKKVKPHRGRDIDCIFLAVKPAEGRLLVPQLRFFDAHDLPLYATAYIYDAQGNVMADTDLDGVIFGDISWLVPDPLPDSDDATSPLQSSEMIETGENAPSVENTTQQSVLADIPRPYRNTPLERLYALGVESYDLLPRLVTLQANPWQRYSGQTMNLTVAADGTVVRHPEWARFENGRPQPLVPNIQRY